MTRLVLALICLALPGVAVADPICPDSPPGLDKHRYLRALSLDLRGTVPSMEEHDALDTLDDVPDAWIDEWLATDAFADRTLRLHQDLLWLPIVGDEVINRRSALSRSGDRHWRRDRARQLRGNTDRVPCADVPAEFDADGQPILALQEDETWREGWVMVAPYWSPDESIKVCALDARENEWSTDGDHCATNNGQGDTDCGCGPAMEWCVPPGGETDLEGWLVEDVERRIRDIALEDRPYTDLFTSTTGYVNGPLVHYWRSLAPMATNVDMTPSPLPAASLPDLTWADVDTWVPIELGPQHAGVLTSVPFLLRFNSNRARANRFYERFLCRPFVPPAGGIPSSGDEVVTLDLQERDGCKYCHALLEPAAAHWGRWSVGGAAFLDPTEYPPLRDDCYVCATTSVGCSNDCRAHYVTDALAAEQEPYLGQLLAYEFREDAHKAGVEEGPALLARTAIVDGRLPACTSRTAADWLLGDSAADADPAWYDELGEEFVDSDFSWRALVKAVVTSDTYGRVR